MHTCNPYLLRCRPCLQLIKMPADHVVIDEGGVSSRDKFKNRGSAIAGIADVFKVL